MPRTALSIAAPAKINLHLHITGRRPDGYHELKSLVAFADISDIVTLTPADSFSFTVDGPFSSRFGAADLQSGEAAANLAVRAARGLSARLGRNLDMRLNLTKNLPLASGIGGGSADAAATVRALLQWWDIESEKVEELDEFLLSLGADVPACFAGRPVTISGIGDIVTPYKGMKNMPVVLINPGKPCPTAKVFARYRKTGGKEGNDLIAAAIEIVPEIAVVLETLAREEGCSLARMSGSGATCFGLFKTATQAKGAERRLAACHPHWWVKSGLLLGA